MKSICTIIFVVSLLSVSFAQQRTVPIPANIDLRTLSTDAAAYGIKPYRTVQEPLISPFKNTVSRGPLAPLNTQTEIGLMANCFAMLEEEQCQISFDPPTKAVAIAFRGNDRGTTNGNTLFMRYSTDNGTSWTAKGNNLSNTSTPRYPQAFLYNPTKSAQVADVKAIMMWSSLVPPTGGGAATFGQVDVMKAGIGNTGLQYGRFPTGGGLPAWNIPSRIIAANDAGKMFTHVLALEPSNGNSTSDEFFMQSTDGLTWTTIGSDPFITYTNYSEFNIFNTKYDVSPDGKNIIFAFIAGKPFSAASPTSSAWVEEHRIGYFESTDGGVTWPTTPSFVSFADMTGLPDELSPTPKMGLEVDVVYDANKDPHFLILATGDINPLDPSADAPQAGQISIRHIDSTMVAEVCRKSGSWYFNPIAMLNSIYITRRSFSQSFTDGSERYRNFQHEFAWARSMDGKKLYAKWIEADSVLKHPYIVSINGNAALNKDTITQVWVAGRHIDSKNAGSTWGGWSDPIKLTSGTDVGAKLSKMANLAGDNGELQIIYCEFGPSDFRDHDDDPLNSDNVVWYINDAKVPGVTVGVETISDAPGSFSLAQNYPNPFGPGRASVSTSIAFTLPRAGQTTLSVYNVLGRKVATVLDANLQSGTHRMSFDASKLPGGVYIYRLDSGSFTASRSMTIVR
jgi:hypothetical protein